MVVLLLKLYFNLSYDGTALYNENSIFKIRLENIRFKSTNSHKFNDENLYNLYVPDDILVLSNNEPVEYFPGKNESESVFINCSKKLLDLYLRDDKIC